MSLPTAMRVRYLAILVLAIPIRAETKVQAIAKEIEADAKRENPRMGLDTLISAADRLRSVDPPTARHLLDTGTAWLDSFPSPSYFALRFVTCYAHIDLDAAEKAAATIKDKMSVYAALIEQSARAKDFERVNRLIKEAAQKGVYSSGAIESALRSMAPEAPQDGITLLSERVTDFPAHGAKAADVHALLKALAIFPSPDVELTKEALRKIFAALDRADFTDQNEEYEDAATYQVHGKEVKTASSFETVLLPAVAYLAVFDPEAFRARLASLPPWGVSLSELTGADLPKLARTPLMGVQKPLGAQAKALSLPDISKMSYEEALSAVHALSFPASYFVMAKIAVRPDFTTEQRRAAFDEIFVLLPQADPRMRYQAAAWALEKAVDSKIDGLFAKAALEYISALDGAISSNDSSLLSLHEHRWFRSEFLRLDALFQQHDFALGQPHPSIVSARALTRLDRAADELTGFTLSSLDGTTYRLRDLKGKIILVDFWATWCSPCRDSLPALEKIHRDWASKGLVVLGVDDEPARIIRTFISEHAITYPMLLDRDRKAHELFGVDGITQGIPLTVVFDREGKFVGRVPYPHTEEGFLDLLRKAGLTSN
jgi:peroxiredoxin